jgi:hypothetical protein
MDKGDKVSVIDSVNIELKSRYGHPIITITPEATGEVISKLLPNQSDVDWVPKIKFVLSNGFELTDYVDTSNLKKVDNK